MDLRITKSKYTPEQRLAIIEEYEKGALSGKEIAEKYGIKYPSQILNWRKRLLKNIICVNREKCVPLHPDTKKNLGPSSRNALQAGRPVGKYRLQAVWPLATGMVSTERDL